MPDRRLVTGSLYLCVSASIEESIRLSRLTHPPKNAPKGSLPGTSHWTCQLAHNVLFRFNKPLPELCCAGVQVNRSRLPCEAVVTDERPLPTVIFPEIFVSSVNSTRSWSAPNRISPSPTSVDCDDAR